MIIVEPSAQLLHITENAEQLLERAGRTCYRSEDKITSESAAQFVRKICQRQHESVLEHASATFVLTIDRGVTHELVRHRIGVAFSQESTRYVNYHKKGEIRVVRPLDLSDDQTTVWLCAMEAAERSYNALIRLGAKPEQARDVLPTCLAADITVTANFRAWRHILRLRTSAAAHPKIRQIMREVKGVLAAHAPTVFGDIL